MSPSDVDLWPPASLSEVWPTLREWAAWWEGSSASLLSAYQGPAGMPAPRPSTYRGGVVGTVARAFWGRPPAFGQPHRGLHVPLATDLCEASADLLFGEPLNALAEKKTAQKTLDAILEDSHETLLGAAEAAAALGGVYLRVTWDKSISPRPFITRMDADAAVPTFTWGRLTAVTFWRVLAVEGSQQTVWRHLEKHSTDASGVGIIEHSLHEGRENQLGLTVPLTDHPSTAPLADILGPSGVVSTESPGLAVVYVPNQMPQRRWRDHPVAQAFGRSDLDGLEPLLDALDEAWSSWMRDLRLGKARLIVPSTMLTDLGPGRGAAMDLDREVYEGVSAGPGSITSGSGQGISAQQFAIRIAEHQGTVSALVKQIVGSAGYSASTFSEGGNGSAITATEVKDRASRTMTTRDRKISAWKRGLTAILEKALAVNAAIFDGPQSEVTVTWADAVAEPMLSLAQTAAALQGAGAASTRTLIGIVHPDWDETQISAELALIEAEKKAQTSAGQDPAGQETGSEQASGRAPDTQGVVA